MKQLLIRNILAVTLYGTFSYYVFSSDSTGNVIEIEHENDLLKKHFLTQFETKRNHERHVSENYSFLYTQEINNEVEDQLWSLIQKISIIYISRHGFNYSQDFLFTGALLDIFENRNITDRNERKMLLDVLRICCN